MARTVTGSHRLTLPPFTRALQARSVSWGRPVTVSAVRVHLRVPVRGYGPPYLRPQAVGGESAHGHHARAESCGSCREGLARTRDKVV